MSCSRDIISAANTALPILWAILSPLRRHYSRIFLGDQIALTSSNTFTPQLKFSSVNTALNGHHILGCPPRSPQPPDHLTSPFRLSSETASFSSTNSRCFPDSVCPQDFPWYPGDSSYLVWANKCLLAFEIQTQEHGSLVVLEKNWCSLYSCTSGPSLAVPRSVRCPISCAESSHRPRLD